MLKHQHGLGAGQSSVPVPTGGTALGHPQMPGRDHFQGIFASAAPQRQPSWAEFAIFGCKARIKPRVQGMGAKCGDFLSWRTLRAPIFTSGLSPRPLPKSPRARSPSGEAPHAFPAPTASRVGHFLQNLLPQQGELSQTRRAGGAVGRSPPGTPIAGELQ